jgi:hypothetical protein
MSVLLHAVLVQALCGNSVIAAPTDGGFISPEPGLALVRRAGATLLHW